MMYLWTVIAAVVSAVGAWFFLDEFGQREMKKLRQENEQLRKQVQSWKQQPVKYVERNVKKQNIRCETYFPMEDLDDPKKAAEYIEKIIRRRLSECVLKFCNIETRLEPVMNQLIVCAMLQVVLPENKCDLYEALARKAAEYSRRTVIGPE